MWCSIIISPFPLNRRGVLPYSISFCFFLLFVLLLPFFSFFFFFFPSMKWARVSERVCAQGDGGGGDAMECVFDRFLISFFFSCLRVHVSNFLHIWGLEWMSFVLRKTLNICVYCMICLCYFQQTKRINANIIHVWRIAHTIFRLFAKLQLRFMFDRQESEMSFVAMSKPSFCPFLSRQFFCLVCG